MTAGATPSEPERLRGPRTVADIPHPIQAHPVPHPGRWLGGAVLVVVGVLALISIVTNPRFDWATVGTYILDVAVVRGVGWTLLLTVCAMVIAIILAVTLAVMRRSENPILRWVAWFYIWVFRGTPVYTQLVFWGLLSVLYPHIVLGVPFGPTWHSWSTANLLTAGKAAVLGLALNEAAYLAEIVRSGLSSVDRGQTEAALALGMRPVHILWRVVLPQAMRVIVPPTGNETIGMLKTTSLVLAVPFTLDLQFVTNQIANATYKPIPLLLVAAAWYLSITTLLMIGQHFLERYYGRGFNGGNAGRASARQEAITEAGTTPAAPITAVEQ